MKIKVKLLAFYLAKIFFLDLTSPQNIFVLLSLLLTCSKQWPNTLFVERTTKIYFFKEKLKIKINYK